MTLGAGPWRQFREIYLPLLLPGLAVAFCLTFVQAFSVFPSAVLLGDGVRLYGVAGERRPVELERTELDESGQLTSLRYRVTR